MTEIKRPFLKHRYYTLRVLEKLGLARTINVWHTLRYERAKIKLPVLCGVGAAEYIEGDAAVDELWMQPLLAALSTDRGGIFIDVGANVGQALIKLKSHDAEAPWVGFEPNPLCVFFLHQLIEANKWRRCKVVAAALGDAPGVLPLYSSSLTDASATLVEAYVNEAQRPTTLVPVLSLDDVMDSGQLEADEVSAVKIDVEGAELEASRGMAKLLDKHRPAVILEVLPVFSANNVTRLERQLALERFYLERGYRWLRVVKDLERDRRLLRLDPIDEIGVHGDRHACQYVLLPRESYPRPLDNLLAPTAPSTT